MIEDEGVQKLIGQNEFQITLNPKFELNIKHILNAETLEEIVVV